ncbi:MAG: argininosuccinate lyase [Alphaproteobacteria bacterium]|nr:argininosuccinate lyase [Alphaproteobacteria bacterium]PHX98607.1 MAG: argininosuccinate lyase [Rhodospirillaceae bacterium]
MTSKMWGGRFSAGPSAVMAEINISLPFDRRMAAQDVRGSIAHAEMLVARGIISSPDGQVIVEGLNKVAAELANGQFPFKDALEDIHMNVEDRLKDLIGPAAGRLHTARSRNDQVATGFRLWTRDLIDKIDASLKTLQGVMIDKAEQHAGTIMPGFTHMQVGQPVTFGHHLLAYVEMLGRDRGRLADARKRLNELPLGAGALGGTSFPIDRNMTAQKLGFDRPMGNSMDAVADRDFALEVMAAASILSVHMSRLAEELVIWFSPQFGFIKFSDAFTTGSSMMPQKRNPDAAELVRAKSGRVIGALIGLMTVMKGLPMTYSKDMQEDKEALFGVADTLELCIAATTGMIADLEPNPERMRESARSGYSTATDLADWVTQKLNVPFRDAHHITGRAVKLAESKGCELGQLALADLQSIEPRINADVLKVLTVDAAAASRVSYGGTAPDNVRAQAKAARDRFLGEVLKW